MRAPRIIPGDVIEAIVQDQPVDPIYAPVVAFARHVRAVGDGPAPRPSNELAALLEGRTKPDLGSADALDRLAAAGPGEGSGRNHRRTGQRLTTRATGVTTKVAGLGLVAKIGLGTSLAAASVAGAGAAGVLPAAANDTVRDAIEAVSPVHLFDASDEPTSSDDRDPSDRTGTSESDGDEAGDGPAIADDAPGADHRPDPAVDDEPPGQSGDTGLTRANETPAAPHAPDTTPAATAPSTIPAHGPPADPGPADPAQSASSTVPTDGGRADDHIPGA
jgi:hypothetical protein